MLLIGKDGGEKLRSHEIVSPEALSTDRLHADAAGGDARTSDRLEEAIEYSMRRLSPDRPWPLSHCGSVVDIKDLGLTPSRLRRSVLRRDKPFELRSYPSLPVATTPIRGDNDEAFMRLFRFIDRGNETAESAMTTPVFFDGQPGAQEKMSLVMPQKAWTGVPAPSAATVTLEERPAQHGSLSLFGGDMRGARAGRRRTPHG